MSTKEGKKQKGKAQVVEQKSAKKGQKVKPVKKRESSEEESSSEEEVEMEVVQQLKSAKKTPAKQTPAKKTAAKPTPAKKTPAKKTPAKKTPAKKTPAKKVEPESEDEDEEDSEEEEPPKKVAKPGAAKQQIQPDDDDDDDEDLDSDEEEEDDPAPPPPKGKSKVTKPNGKPKQQVAMDDDDSDSDDDDEDDDEEEPPTKVKQVLGAKGVGKKGEVEDDDEESDEDEDDDEDDDEEEDDEAPALKKKKAADGKAVKTKSKAEDVGGEVISIFVAGFPKETPEDELETFFTSNGVKVLNVRIIAKKRFGYADVSSEKMFKKAMKLNHQELNGSEIRMERGTSKGEKQAPAAQKAASGPRDESNTRTLFVKGLCYDTTRETLEKEFGAKEVRLPFKNGRPAGYAYIEFDDEAGVDKAVSEKQGIEIDGWKVMLDFVGEKSKHKAATGGDARGTAQNKTLHIRGLTDDVTEAEIKELLGAVEVRRPTKRSDPSTKVEFAYADFESEEAAKEAMDEHQGATLNDATLALDFARTKRFSDDSGNREAEINKKTLYIRGLSWETTQDRLQSILGSDSVRIPYDRETNQPKGFAYADFPSEGEASAAMSKHSGSDVDGYTLTIEYAKQRTTFGSPRGGGGRGGFGGGFGRGGRGGGFRGGFRGGRGGRGDRGGRGGGFRGGRGGRGSGFGDFKGKKTTFD